MRRCIVLLREDDNIRVLATREIEDRDYVRAKPSREEIEKEKREAELEAQRGFTRTSLGKAPDLSSQAKAKENQEDAYWSTHEETYWSKPKDGQNNPSVLNGPIDQYSLSGAYPANPQAPGPRMLFQTARRGSWTWQVCNKTAASQTLMRFRNRVESIPGA